MSIPEPATNYCPGNGLLHMCREECLNDHPSLLLWSSELHFIT